MWEVEICRLPLQWAQQGDEWHRHLCALLTEAGFNRLSSQGNWGTEVILSSPHHETLLSKLRMTPCAEGILCEVLGDGDEPTEDQVRPWRDAATRAAERVEASTTGFDWVAVIGPHHKDSRREFETETLAEPVRVGPLSLGPGGVFALEMIPRPLLGLPTNGYSTHRSWPLIVEGTAFSYAWDMALQDVRPLVRRLMALLSLAWGGCWVPRYGPMIVQPGRPLEIPPVSGAVAGTPWEDLDVEAVQADARESCQAVELPGWFEQAWAVLDRDPILAEALNSYYEAVRAEAEHPSLAFVAYVAAVEGIGAMTVDLGRCQCCDQCEAQSGSVKRFRTALRTVMSNKDANALTELAYGMRSKTAHQGTLHAAEDALGMRDHSMFRLSPSRAFDTFTLSRMRAACRSVLVRILSGTG